MPSRTAFHEAAHCLALLKSGQPGKGLVEVKLHASGGHTLSWLPLGLNADTAAKVLIVGAVADILLAGGDPQDALACSHADMEKAAAVLKTRARAAAVLTWAASWVRKHDLEIEALAGELDRKGRLSRDEALLVVGMQDQS